MKASTKRIRCAKSRPCFTASKGPGGILVKIHAGRDEAEHEFGLLRSSDATRIACGPVPRGIVGRTDAAAVLVAKFKDEGW